MDVEEWGDDAPRRIMETDRDALLSCEIVVALLDGPQIDDGTAWEIGFAYGKGIPVIGIRTDFHKGGETKKGCMNAMIEASILALFRSVEELLPALKYFGLHGISASKNIPWRP